MATAVFGGMPAWLLRAYLVELGGATADGAGAGSVLAGDGWRATIEPAPAGGPMRIARVTVSIEGERAPEIMAALRQKAQRGGG